MSTAIIQVIPTDDDTSSYFIWITAVIILTMLIMLILILLLIVRRREKSSEQPIPLQTRGDQIATMCSSPGGSGYIFNEVASLA